MPEVDDNEVCNTEIGLAKNQDFVYVANLFNSEAKEIVERYNKGELR